MSLIPIDTVKEALQIMHSKEDTFLQIALDAIEEWVATFCGMRFNATAADAAVPHEDLNGGKLNLWATQHPILAVESVQDRDADSETIGATLWRNNENRLWYRDGSFWADGVERFRVTYTAGYTIDTLPSSIKLVILQLCHRWYNKRGGIGSDMVSGFSTKWEDLLNSDEVKLLRSFSFNGPFS